MDNQDVIFYKFCKHYGEFKIKYWIELLLKGKIILPSYQRDFVWSPKKVISLFDSMNQSLFIPPVTIGLYYNKDKKSYNYIIDGQQRLTSLLLFVLELYPRKDSAELIKNMENEDDEEKLIFYDDNFIIQCIQNIAKNINEYRDYKKIASEALKTNKFSNLNEILPKNESYVNIDYYDEIKSNVDKILNNYFLGYSYVKPNESLNGINDYKFQQKFFSSVFMNINGNGDELSRVDRRKALYWISENEELFDPKFLIMYIKSKEKIDFTRILSFTSEYYNLYLKEKNVNAFREYKIGKNCRTLENYDRYFVEFVNSYISEDNSKFFIKINNKSEELKKYMQLLNFPKEFKNFVELDIYMFGIIFWLYFKNLRIKENINFKEYSDSIKLIIEKNTPKETNEYNRIGEIRKRIKLSIEFYKQYFVGGLF